MKDFIFNFEIITMFTDIDVSNITNPENTEAIDMIEKVKEVNADKALAIVLE